jgi:hypothetical protein
MSFSDQVDHEEIAAVAAEARNEAEAELMDEMEATLARLVRAARTVESGSLFEMTDKLGTMVLDQNMNVGELSMLAGLLALSLGRPAEAGRRVDRLAKHLYHQAHGEPGTKRGDYAERRWNDDDESAAELRDKFRTKAATLLAIAFDV